MNTVLKGAIHTIFKEERFGDFIKRVFWVKEINVKYPNIWQLEMWHDDTTALDKLREADLVECNVEVRGKMWEKYGKTNVLNILRCTGIKKT